jgi:hypothetical protein
MQDTARYTRESSPQNFVQTEPMTSQGQEPRTETSVNLYTRRYDPAGGHLHTNRRENLGSYQLRINCGCSDLNERECATWVHSSAVRNFRICTPRLLKHSNKGGKFEKKRLYGSWEVTIKIALERGCEHSNKPSRTERPPLNTMSNYQLLCFNPLRHVITAVEVRTVRSVRRRPGRDANVVCRVVRGVFVLDSFWWR